MTGSVGKVGAAIMVSRVLGLARDLVFAFCFGAGSLMDCFQTAFRIPNMLRDLFAEGALSTAFVTVFVRRRAREGDASARLLARLVVTFQVLLLAGVVVMGILFAPRMVRIIAPGFSDSKLELTATLTRILFPFILFLGMAALAMGVLNSHGRFGLPASASSFFNLGSIVVGLGLALIYDPQFGPTAIVCMAIGALTGGFLQWFIQVPALRALGYRFQPAWDLHDSGLREIGRLMAPTLVGLSAVQINVMINTIFASHMGDGAVSWLAYAFRIIQLPIGLFGVAISMVALPSLAVEAMNADKEPFRMRVERALRLNAALCIPAACGLAILSRPLVSALFERGRFDAEDTATTAGILCAYALGLVGYASVKVLVAAFYALNRTTVPMVVSLASIAATVLLNWFFVYKLRYGAAGLALATSLSALGSAGILWSVLTGLVGGFSRQGWDALGRILLAAAIMSLAVVFILWIHTKLDVNAGLGGNLSRVFFGGGAGVLIYGFAARILKLEEALAMENVLRSKLGLARNCGSGEK